MDLDTRPRGAGRTSELIRWAAAEPAAPGPMRYIVCHSHAEAYRVRAHAEDMGVQIAFPLTWREAIGVRGLSRPMDLAVDNLSLILPTLTLARIVKVVW